MSEVITDVNHRMALKFKEASWGDVSIEEEDLESLGIKKQKTFKSKTRGYTLRINTWERFCIFVYEKLTGEKHPGITAMGRGFRSRQAANPIVNVLLERAGKEPVNL